MPTTILASRYNDLRNTVNLILGTSNNASPTFGYGQSFSTDSVIGTRSVAEISDADKISAQQYEDLYIDIVRTKSHQVGASNITIDEFVVGDFETNLSDTDKIEEAYVSNLESIATDITTDKFVVSPTNLSIANVPLATSTRTSSSSWSTRISHIFTMTFNTELERRHFFNAGGQIRLTASVNYTGSQAKTVDWQNILSNMGSTSFKADETINNSNVGTGSNRGAYDLTTSYRLVYSRTGGSVYARNRYNIYAREYATGDSTSAIQFKVDFVDGRPNDLTYGIDEPVYGTFTSTVETATPNSQVTINGTVYNAVVIDSIPTGAMIRELS